jgi:hypothetical protein
MSTMERDERVTVCSTCNRAVAVIFAPVSADECPNPAECRMIENNFRDIEGRGHMEGPTVWFYGKPEDPEVLRITQYQQKVSDMRYAKLQAENARLATYARVAYGVIALVILVSMLILETQ